MTGKKLSKSASLGETSEAYYDQFPTCEYCGHVVFPGEERAIDHDSLIWHSEHCFRCFGCDRVFTEGRPCHILLNIALCDDCYPRREFLAEEWKALNKGVNSSNKQRRVCFLSPGTRPESKNNALCAARDSLMGMLNQDKSGFSHVRKQLAFAQDDPRVVKELAAGNKENASNAVMPELSAEIGNLLSDNQRKENVNKEAPVVREAARRITEKMVTAQIADAMVDVVNFNPKRPPIANERKTDGGEKVMVDDRYMVLAVNEWDEVVEKSRPGGEYINKDPRVNLTSSGWPPAGIEPPYRSIRRSSSCSDVYKTPAGSDSLESPPVTFDSNHSEIQFHLSSGSDEKEEFDPTRDAGLCNSISPMISSTPIPQCSHGSSTNDRPPSSFCEANAFPPCHWHVKAVPSHDAGVEDEEHQSFEEIRAIFQQAPEENHAKICCDCKSEVLPAERFDCLHQVYHMRCFRCATCRARLNPRTFRDDGKRPFCKTCFVDLKVSKNRCPRISPPRSRVNSL